MQVFSLIPESFYPDASEQGTCFLYLLLTHLLIQRDIFNSLQAPDKGKTDGIKMRGKEERADPWVEDQGV